MADKFGVRPVDLPGASKSASDDNETIISRSAETDLVDKFAAAKKDKQADKTPKGDA